MRANETREDEPARLGVHLIMHRLRAGRIDHATAEADLRALNVSEARISALLSHESIGMQRSTTGPGSSYTPSRRRVDIDFAIGLIGTLGFFAAAVILVIENLHAADIVMVALGGK